MDQSIGMMVAVFAGFVFCIVVHECAHAVVANWLGDPTARDLGRITLNPIPHIDLFMSIIMPLALFLTNSGIIFGGAKPVPVNMNNFRHPLRDMMWVALAGPVSNILLAVTFALLINLVPALDAWNPKFAENFLVFLDRMVIINVVLACFNMIPIPPLDGSRLLAAFLPRNLAMMIYTYQAQMVGMLLVIVLVYSGGTNFIVPVVKFIRSWLFEITVFVD